MALVLPIFLLILFGLIDVGRLVFTNSMVSQAAREGARLAAVQARWIGKTMADDPACVVPPSVITAANPGGHICPQNDAKLRELVQAAVNGELVGVGTIPLASVYLSCNGATVPTGAWTLTSCSANPHSKGDLVSVRVVLTYQPITPIAGSFFGSIVGPINLAGAATMVIN